MFETFFVLPYEEDDEFFVGDQLLNLLRKKPTAPPPKPEIGSAARPYVWSYILSQKRDSHNTHSHAAIESRNSFSIIDKPAVVTFQENTSQPSTNDTSRGSPLPQIRPLSAHTSIRASDDTPTSNQPTIPDQNIRSHSSISDVSVTSYDLDNTSVKKLDTSGLRMSLKDSMWMTGDQDDKCQAIQDTVSKLCNQQRIITQLVSSPIKKALPVPYHEQGSIDMYSAENLKKRLDLKHDETIQSIISHWWNATVKSKEQPDVITKIAYLSLVMAVYTVMMPDDAGKTLEDARRNAEKDWRVDARGGLVMDYMLFYDAIFELADVWCETTQKREYVLFLDVLFQKVFMDITLPKVIRKHIDQKYITFLRSKTREKRLASMPPKSPKKRQKINKKRVSTHVRKKKKKTKKDTKKTISHEFKKDEAVVSDLNSPGTNQHKTTNAIENDNDSETAFLSSEFDRASVIPEVSVSTEIPVVVVKHKDLNNIGTQTPRSKADTILNNKLQSILDKLEYDSNIQQRFLHLLRQNDNFILERTIFNRLVSDIKSGQKSYRGINLLSMLSQNIITNNYQAFMRVGDKINLKELLSVIIHLSQDQSEMEKQNSSVFQISSPRDMLKKRRSMTNVELLKEKEEYMGHKPGSARIHRQKFNSSMTEDISSVFAKLSQNTWTKLLQFAEFLAEGDTKQVIAAIDKAGRLGDGNRASMTPDEHFRNQVYKDAMERYMGTEGREDSIVLQTTSFSDAYRSRGVLTREETLRELFREAEKLRSTDTNQGQRLPDHSIQFSDSPRETVWSALDFFQNNVEVEGEDSDWWEGETRSDESILSQQQMDRLTSEDSRLEREELRYNYGDITDLFPEDKKGAEELKEVVRRFSAPMNRFYPTQIINNEYRVPKKAQKNLLLVSSEAEESSAIQKQTRQKRNSWLPVSSPQSVHVRIPNNITGKKCSEADSPQSIKGSSTRTSPNISRRSSMVESLHSPTIRNIRHNKTTPNDALKLIEGLPPNFQREGKPMTARQNPTFPVQVSKLSSKSSVYKVH